MTRLARLAGGFLVAWLLMAVAAHEANACRGDARSESRIVGVDERGNFVVWQYTSSVGRHGHDFTLFDAGGRELEGLSSQDGYPPWHFDHYPKVAGSDRLQRFAGSDGDVGRLEAKIRDAMGLTAVSADSRRTRLRRDRGPCGAIEVETESGFVRAFDLHPHGDEIGCVEPRVSFGRHGGSELLFVRMRWRHVAHDGIRTDDDTVSWFPARRIVGIAAAERGAELRRTGRFDEAIRWLDASLALAPEYIPSRVDAALATRQAGGERDAVGRYLTLPATSGAQCVGWKDAIDTMRNEAPPDWNVEEVASLEACSSRFGWDPLWRPDQGAAARPAQNVKPAAPLTPQVPVVAPAVWAAPPAMVSSSSFTTINADAFAALGGALAVSTLIALSPRLRRRRRLGPRDTGSPYRSAPRR